MPHASSARQAVPRITLSTGFATLDRDETR
jgi:hypothetical protein